MGLAGRSFYQLWHRPLAVVDRCIKDGGPWEQWRTARSRHTMRAIIPTLPVITGIGRPLELHLLTGANYWDQTVFCLWSLAHHSGRPLQPVIYDDGSLGHRERTPLQRLFPTTRFIEKIASIETLERRLPSDRFPFLRDRWVHYPNIRKLIDPHLDSTGWKLVIDSDLLFFRSPEFLVQWLDQPDRCLHAVDIETSYGYDRALMNRLAGAPVADLVNVGLTGLRSDSLDWDRLEYFCRELISTAGTHYYLEQALIAMLVAGQPCAVAPKHDYVTCPDVTEAERCTAVMHHYVAHSRKWHYRRNWRIAIAPTSSR